MTRAIILLGSNINKEKNMAAAIHMLRERCDVQAVSTIYETVPMGLRNQPNFYNAAVMVKTDLAPAGLKETVLTPIEQELRRVRTDDKNAARTIDADIVLYGQDVTDYDNHHLPDPDLLKFAHVAVPVAEVAPDWPHPETGEPLQYLATRLLEEQTAAYDADALVWPAGGDVGTHTK